MENQNRKFSKKRIAVIAAIVCCIAMVAAGSVAYFTAEETARNVITTGRLAMELHEETTGGKPFPADGIDNVMPGTQVDKVVYVENTGSVDFYCRIRVEKAIEAAQGVNAQLNFKNITLDIDTKHWTEKDGYYYYTKALKPGEVTAPVFTAVTFNAAMGNEYQNATATVDVMAQAVQTANNGATVMDAQGWPAA